MKTSSLCAYGLGPAALGLALTVAAAGCGSDSTVGGLTNPNAGSVVDRDTARTRDDLPAPDLNASRKEPIAESAASSPSSTGTTAGTGGPGGGQPGKTSTEAATPTATPATPAAKENSGEASGGTKPADTIKEGTPKSPQ